MSGSESRLRHGDPRRWAAPFVLAMLCLRALVPAGFMLAAVDGRLDIVLCDTDARGAAHQHAGHDHSGRHLHTHLDSTCPYAQSAGPAPLPALPVLAAPAIADSPALPARAAQTCSQFGPTRQHCPRAPPYLT